MGISSMPCGVNLFHGWLPPVAPVYFSMPISPSSDLAWSYCPLR
jgi:hypothetical protein